MRNKYNLLSGILLGIILLAAWLKIVNWQEFLSYFKSFDLRYILLFSLFYGLAYFLRSLRWRLILSPIYRMSVRESFTLFMSGLLINYLIPVRAGEFAKSIILKKKRNVRISASLPSIFIDKMSDLFPILLIMVLIPLVAVKLNLTLKIIIILLFFIFLVFIAFLFFAVNHQGKAVKILHFWLRFFPQKIRKRLEDFFLNFVSGMTIMQNRTSDNIIVYCLTLLAVLSEAVYIYAVFRSFGAEVGYAQILFGYTLMNLTYILPTPPAQIGSNQFLWVLIFSLGLGIDKNLTSAAVTFSHLLTSIWIFGLGAISLLALNISFGEIVHRNNIEDDDNGK